MKKKPLSAKIKNKEKVILYEFLPPPMTLSQHDLETSIALFASVLPKYAIDAVNIPEVREETRSGKRAGTSIVKIAPRVVSSLFRTYSDCDVIINRPIVYHSWEEQEKWLLESYQTYDIRNFVLVGGESSTIAYPGPSVVDAAKAISLLQFPDIFLGGICIPTRHNESERVVKKAQAGIHFFTTQVLYEATAVKKFLQEYWDLCKKQKIDQKMIFLSFAPAVTPSDIQLLLWLGVVIPKETIEQLQTGWIGMGFRSLRICEDVLTDILQFAKKQKIKIPLGINIEHISRHNFEVSFLLLERLSSIYNKYDYI